MKKIKTRLQLTKNTVRVLQNVELATVNGGLRITRPSSDDPAACIVGGGNGSEKL